MTLNSAVAGIQAGKLWKIQKSESSRSQNLVLMCRANSHTPLVLYLPTLEAWALETATLTSEDAEEGLAPATRQAATGPTSQRNAQPSITPLKSYPASISPFR